MVSCVKVVPYDMEYKTQNHEVQFGIVIFPDWIGEIYTTSVATAQLETKN